MAGTEYNRVGQDDRHGGGKVGAHDVREVRQVRGAGGSGVRTTGRSTTGEVRGIPYSCVKIEEVSTAAVRRERENRER